MDCEGHVDKVRAGILAKSVNHRGLESVCGALRKTGVQASVNGPYRQLKLEWSPYSVLSIGGVSNLALFRKVIWFNHPTKDSDLASIV